MATEEWQFESRVCRADGDMQPHCVPVPDEVAEALRQAEISRLIVRFNGYELRRALQGSREFGSHIIVGLAILKEIGLRLDDTVSVSIEADPEPQRIDLCEEFLIALEQDEEAKERFNSMTLGKQRSLAYHVSSAKREETRIKRALDLAMKLRTRTLHGD